MKEDLSKTLQVPSNLHASVLALSTIHKGFFDLIEFLGGRELAEAFEKVNQGKYSTAAKTGKGGDRGGKGRPDGFTSKKDFFDQIGIRMPRSIAPHIVNIINEHKRVLLAYYKVTGKRFE
jgi:hypothetical protein